MIYLEQIEIVGNSFPGSEVLKTGFKFECSDVNVFVGQQGCGKSTLLKLLKKNHKDIKIQLSQHVLDNGVNSFFFDSENDNPRTKNPELYTAPSGEDVGIGFINAVTSRFQSHGEIMEKFIIGPLEMAKNSVILLDEPESALSITNQFKLISAIKTAVNNNCQIFIATHCYPLIETFDVISLEHFEKMSGVDFINKVKN